MIVGGIFQKVVYPFSCGGGGSTYAETRAYRLQIARGVSVEVKIALFARDAVPEVDVGLIPDLEVPLRNFIDTVPIDQVLREVCYQGIPGFHALRRRNILLIPEGMQRIGIEGELFGHEADLDDGTHAVFEQAIVDLVDIGEVIDRVAVLVFVVDAVLVVKNGMETHVMKIGSLLYRAQVVAVALAQRKIGTTGAEHLLPEVRKRCRLRLRVDFNFFLGE